MYRVLLRWNLGYSSATNFITKPQGFLDLIQLWSITLGNSSDTFIADITLKVEPAPVSVNWLNWTDNFAILNLITFTENINTLNDRKLWNIRNITSKATNISAIDRSWTSAQSSGCGLIILLSVFFPTLASGSSLWDNLKRIFFINKHERIVTYLSF